MKAKLQVALDDLSMEEALKLIGSVQDHIDIVEIGTPFMMEYGMNAVEEFARTFPQLEILCDGKIMDAGGYEAEIALIRGASYVTVLGVTDNRTIADVVETAHKRKKKVMVDMLCVSDLKSRIAELEEMDVDILAVHTGVDQQAEGRTPLDDLILMRKYTKRAAIAVAGGINEKTIQEYLPYQPEIIIVGGGLCHAKDPVACAAELRRKIETASMKGETK